MTAERVDVTPFDALGFDDLVARDRPGPGRAIAFVDGTARGKRPPGPGWWLRVSLMPVLALLALAVWFGVERIEAQVEEGARLAAIDAGISVDRLVFVASYRDVEVRGQLPAGVEAAPFERLLEDETAPNGADIRRASVVADPTTSPFDVRVVADGRSIVLTGSVPLEAHRVTLVEAARTSGIEVDDRLEVAGARANVSDPAATMAPLVEALAELGPEVSAARLRLTDAGLDGEIETATSDARGPLATAVAEADEVDVSSVAATNVALTWDGNLLILDGFITVESHADLLRQAAHRAIGAPRVIANLKIRGSAEPVADVDGNIDTMAAVISVLDRFRSVEARLDGNDLAITGEAIDPDARADIDRVVAANAGDDLRATIDLDLVYPLSAADEGDLLQTEFERLEDVLRRDLRFETESFELDDAARSALDQVAAALGRYSRPVVEISGHADDRGPDWFNELLSRERADAVAGYLVERGIPADRLNPIGLGAARPLDSGNPDEDRAASRRVDFAARGSF